MREKVPYNQRLIDLWILLRVNVSPEMFSFPSVLTDALHCWMVRIFTHPIMPTGPEGGGFTASSRPPPHTNLPRFTEDRVSLSLRYSFLSLTWAKHAPVFWRPLWNCHVLRHLCCGSNYTSRVGRYFTTYKKCQRFVWWLAGELRRHLAERLEICVRPVFVSRHRFPLLLHHLL